MTTQIEFSDQEIADLKELTNETDVAAAIRKATKEYIRYIRSQDRILSPQVNSD